MGLVKTRADSEVSALSVRLGGQSGFLCGAASVGCGFVSRQFPQFTGEGVYLGESVPGGRLPSRTAFEGFDLELILIPV